MYNMENISYIVFIGGSKHSACTNCKLIGKTNERAQIPYMHIVHCTRNAHAHIHVENSNENYDTETFDRLISGLD